jgi:hypothetical protein
MFYRNLQIWSYFFLTATLTLALSQVALTDYVEVKMLEGHTHARAATAPDWLYVFVEYSVDGTADQRLEGMPDKIVSATTPIAQEVLLNRVGEFVETGNILALGSVSSRGHLAVRLEGMKSALRDGEKFPLTLVFLNSGAKEIEVAVLPEGYVHYSPVTFEGGDGSAPNRSIVIKGLSGWDELFGMFYWMEQHDRRVADIFIDQSGPSNWPVVASASDGREYFFDTNYRRFVDTRRRWCSESVVAPGAVIDCRFFCFDLKNRPKDCEVRK